MLVICNHTTVFIIHSKVHFLYLCAFKTNIENYGQLYRFRPKIQTHDL